MRREDSPELFGGGVGSGRYAEITCEWCGAVHNKGCEDDRDGGESVCWTDFAGKLVCDCCFEAIEEEVLDRLPDILPWAKRILTQTRDSLQRGLDQAQAVEQMMEEKP